MEIVEEWKPTIENVVREFCVTYLRKFYYGEGYIDLHFNFEDEGLNFVIDKIKKYDDLFYKMDVNTLIEDLKKIDSEIPTIMVSDYKQFFMYLTKLYEKSLNFTLEKTNYFCRTDKNRFFETIWLRMTPEDFHNPEEFLKRELIMANDKTFDKYNDRTIVGLSRILKNSIITIKNSLAMDWDECYKQLEVTVHDKDSYLIFRENGKHYDLPVIRYGIYEKDGKKICRIGSIQNKDLYPEDKDFIKTVERAKYKANDGVPLGDDFTEYEVNSLKVEPKALISLAVFINLLHSEGITDIEIPSFYVLDYDYHQKLANNLALDFMINWVNDIPEQDSKDYELYKRDLETLNRYTNKEEFISLAKTEGLLKIINRILFHYMNGTVQSYPTDVEMLTKINIPIVDSELDINGPLFKELYAMVNNMIKTKSR